MQKQKEQTTLETEVQPSLCDRLFPNADTDTIFAPLSASPLSSIVQATWQPSPTISLSPLLSRITRMPPSRRLAVIPVDADAAAARAARTSYDTELGAGTDAASATGVTDFDARVASVACEQTCLNGMEVVGRRKRPECADMDFLDVADWMAWMAAGDLRVTNANEDISLSASANCSLCDPSPSFDAFWSTARTDPVF